MLFRPSQQLLREYHNGRHCDVATSLYAFVPTSARPRDEDVALWILSSLMMDVRGFRYLVASCPFWLTSPADSLQKSMRTLAQTSWCCSEMRRVQEPCVAAVRIDKAARVILAMDIVVNDRTYRFSEVVPILLSSSWPWECFAEAVQTDKLYTLKPRAPYQ